MKPWIESKACASRAFCRDCRTNPDFRQTILNIGKVSQRDFACPEGFSADNLPEKIITPTGPGTELKKILEGIGIAPGNCKCNAMAAKMDAWGPDGCDEHMAEIVAAMTEAANKRGWMKLLPFKELGARGLVALAIRNSKV